jgi:hypothetical protein
VKIERIQLDPKDCDHIIQLEKAINTWSVQLGQLELNVDEAKSQLAGLYRARNEYLNDHIIVANIDPATIINKSVNLSEGHITLTIRDNNTE